MQEISQKRVIIVGAGLSGLTTANDILEKDTTAHVTIVEAMDRVGGRTLSIPVDGAYYDLGAEWIGPKQDYAKELAMKSKNELIPQFCEGTKVMEFGKSIETYAT